MTCLDQHPHRITAQVLNKASDKNSASRLRLRERPGVARLWPKPSQGDPPGVMRRAGAYSPGTCGGKRPGECCVVWRRFGRCALRRQRSHVRIVPGALRTALARRPSLRPAPVGPLLYRKQERWRSQRAISQPSLRVNSASTVSPRYRPSTSATAGPP